MHQKNAPAGHTTTSNNSLDEITRKQYMKSGYRTITSDSKSKLAPLSALISLTLLAGCIDGDVTSATGSAATRDADIMSGLDADSTSAKPDESNREKSDKSHDKSKSHEKGAGKRKTEKRVYYGDYSSNRAFVIDVDSMKVEKVISNTGKGPYETDQV